MSHVLSDVFGQPIVATVAGVAMTGTLGFLGAEAGYVGVNADGFAPTIMEGVKWGAVGAVPGVMMGAAKDIMGEKYDPYEPEPEPHHMRASRAHDDMDRERARVEREDRDFREAIRARERDYLPEPEQSDASTRYKGERAMQNHAQPSAPNPQEYAEFQEFQKWRQHVKGAAHAPQPLPFVAPAYPQPQLQPQLPHQPQIAAPMPDPVHYHPPAPTTIAAGSAAMQGQGQMVSAAR